ncbi:MAG: hypothetical protein WD771_00675 [Gemmatimonadaceae bacterium]
MSQFRLRAAVGLVAAAFTFAACGEGTTLPTTVDPVEMQADIEAVESAFAPPATQSFATMGYSMDAALAAIGGATVVHHLPAQMLTEGPVLPLRRMRDRIVDVTASETADAVPVTALGKTFVFNASTWAYEIDNTRTGAPAGGVRFILYALDIDGFIIVPLSEVGYADLTSSGSGSSATATVSVFATGGTKVMEYTATVGGTTSVPTFAVDGFAGTGVNQVTFELAVGISVNTGAITVYWRADVPSRGLSTRIQLAIGSGDDPSVTIGALMRNGVRKVEIGGTVSYFGGGTLTVKVGNKVFATITLDEYGDAVIVDKNGAPLSAEDEETLERIFNWFGNAFGMADALLAPLFVLLGLDDGGTV